MTMRGNVFSCTAVVAAIVAFCAAPLSADVVLAPGRTQVVIPAAAPKAVVFAAEEMTNFLSRVLGDDVPLASAPLRGWISVHLGDSEYVRKAGIDISSLQRDAFRILVDGQAVYIAGRDDAQADTRHAVYSPHTGYWAQYHEHATLFGVYEFLERFAGVRFYFPGELGTIVPRHDELRIPSLSLKIAPDFLVRNYSAFSDGLYFAGENPGRILHPARKLNYQRNRMQTLYVPCCHGQNGFSIQQRFAKEHPEFMQLGRRGGKLVRDTGSALSAHHVGQLCHSSGVYDEMFKDILAYAHGKPPSSRGIHSKSWPIMTFRRPWVDIMPQDGFQACLCERCQAVYRDGDEHYASELVWGRTVELAERLSGAGVDLRLTQMAYPPYRRIPDLNIPSNVDVMVAESGPWSCSNADGFRREMDEIRRWSEKISRKVWIWTYPNKFGAMNLPAIPNGTPRAWAKYYREAAPWIFGAFAECENDRFFYNALSYYIFGKVCWNTRVDTEVLLDEYFRLMFGPGAEPMSRLVADVENKWVNDVAGTLVETAEGPKRQPPSPYALYCRIYSPETLARWDGWLTSAHAAVPRGSLYSRRVELYRREIFEPLATAAATYRKGISLKDELSRRALASTRTNLLVNADFSAAPAGASKRHFGFYRDAVRGYGWLGGWICGEKDLPHLSFCDAPPGVSGRALRMEQKDSARKVQISNHFMGMNGRFKPGVRYRVSFFVRLTDVVPREPGGGAGVRVWCDHNSWFPKNRLTGTTDWIHQEFFFTAGPKSESHDSQFSVYLWAATGRVEYVGFRVEEMPSAK